MDQTNPWLKSLQTSFVCIRTWWFVTERAGFEVRDVHYTTMVVSFRLKLLKVRNIGFDFFCVYAKINEGSLFQLLIVKVVDGKVDKVLMEYLTAEEKKNKIIAQVSPIG